jgi:glutamyl-tRNA synthetase
MPSRKIDDPKTYRGRIAPTPSGLLHVGHARTFWIAWWRSRISSGSLIYRNEDLDPQRCKANFTQAALEDMLWLGLNWEEGPDIGGVHAPYHQSQRTGIFRKAFFQLMSRGFLYPCRRSRKELREYAVSHGLSTQDPIYPVSWRPKEFSMEELEQFSDCAWRFRVPTGRVICFEDQNSKLGHVCYEAGKDFGDFVVWRRDDVPAYELAVVVDDIAMGITEVVRGQDLLMSTARQILLFEALEATAPAYFHCPLLLDEEGRKLSKSLDSRSIEQHRLSGVLPDEWIQEFRGTYDSLV